MSQRPHIKRRTVRVGKLYTSVVTANYAPDAVLLPTVSNQPRTNSAEIKDYFVHFLKRNPQGTIDTRTIWIGCNTASDVGTYTFRLSGKTPGTTDILKARYSFDYELRDGKWVIVNHHSLMMGDERGLYCHVYYDVLVAPRRQIKHCRVAINQAPAR